MARSRITCALLLLALACADEVEVGSDEPPPVGEEIYHIYPGFCLSDCWDYGLSLDGDVLELRAHEAGSFIGLSRADIKPETVAELHALRGAIIEAHAAGTLDEQADCFFFDVPRIVASFGDFELDYDYGCPPEQLAELDTLLDSCFDDLVWCQPSSRLSPQIGCEVLMPTFD